MRVLFTAAFALSFMFVGLSMGSIVPRVSAQESIASIAARLGDGVESVAVDGEDGVGAGNAVTIISAPVDQVMSIVTDYAKYAEFMPHFTRSRILSQRGTGALVYMQASGFHDTVHLWVNLRLRERPAEGDTRIIEGSMAGGNVTSFRARWELTPLDDEHTVVRFVLLVDPDLPFPTSIITGENVRNARRVLLAVRDRVR